MNVFEYLGKGLKKPGFLKRDKIKTTAKETGDYFISTPQAKSAIEGIEEKAKTLIKVAIKDYHVEMRRKEQPDFNEKFLNYGKEVLKRTMEDMSHDLLPLPSDYEKYLRTKSQKLPVFNSGWFSYHLNMNNDFLKTAQKQLENEYNRINLHYSGNEAVEEFRDTITRKQIELIQKIYSDNMEEVSKNTGLIPAKIDVDIPKYLDPDVQRKLDYAILNNCLKIEKESIERQFSTTRLSCVSVEKEKDINPIIEEALSKANEICNTASEEILYHTSNEMEEGKLQEVKRIIRQTNNLTANEINNRAKSEAKSKLEMLQMKTYLGKDTKKNFAIIATVMEECQTILKEQCDAVKKSIAIEFGKPANSTPSFIKTIDQRRKNTPPSKKDGAVISPIDKKDPSKAL
ncbi:MAG: hypothetical protein PHD60_03920 [Clostridia bacterium]|nr:hypothetical protein [Clostridia bacterium]